MGRALLTPGFREEGMIVGRHRHHRRDGDAAQPLPAFGPGPVAASSTGDEPTIRRAISFNTIDTVVALSVAFLVNAAILVLAAMVFHGKESVTLPRRRGRVLRARTPTGSASPT